MSFSASLSKISDTVLEIRIKEGNRLVYKEKCNIHNKKNISKMLYFIKLKFGYDLIKIIEDYNDNDWFK